MAGDATARGKSMCSAKSALLPGMTLQARAAHFRVVVCRRDNWTAQEQNEK
jgi:hypothetical protein